MRKYIKLEDAINEVAIYLSCDYPTEERAREDVERLFTNVPTIEAITEDFYEMSTKEAIEYLNKMFQRADFSDEYGDCVDTDPYANALRMATDALYYREWMGINSTEQHGHWIYGNGNGECSVCGRERSRGWDNYCGYCGARMKR